MSGNGALFLDPAKTALLIVDMQNDFLHRDGYFARCGLPVEALTPAIVATTALRDGLPASARIIYTIQLYEPDGSDDIVRLHRIKPVALARSGDEIPVQRGNWGAEIVSELRPRSHETVIEKHRFDAFHQTELETLLRGWGITTVLFAGVIVDVCVETSLRSAFMRDFDVILAQDCVAGWSEHHLARTADVVTRVFGASLSNAQIMAAFGDGAVAPARSTGTR
jgi:ureidoacrylate peracid hydrolase